LSGQSKSHESDTIQDFHFVNPIFTRPPIFLDHQAERWFGLITQQTICRGSFRSVCDLVARVNEFVDHYNRNCRSILPDRNRRLNLPKTCPTMYMYFRDGTSAHGNLFESPMVGPKLMLRSCTRWPTARQKTASPEATIFQTRSTGE
jgi:hypothetical protein